MFIYMPIVVIPVTKDLIPLFELCLACGREPAVRDGGSCELPSSERRAVVLAICDLRLSPMHIRLQFLQLVCHVGPLYRDPRPHSGGDGSVIGDHLRFGTTAKTDHLDAAARELQLDTTPDNGKDHEGGGKGVAVVREYPEK